ncbi:MAG: GNAT family N-acetyltransferase [Coprobacillus sp.]
MQNNIYFREIKSSDYQELETLIRETWNYDSFCCDKTASRLAKLYLMSCLSNQTYTCVAIKDEKPVGIIMGKNEKKFRYKLKFYFQQMISIISLSCTKEGRRTLKLFSGFHTIDKDLLVESGESFDGELAFFAVAGNQRGTGIGKELFNRLLSYMKSQDIKSFYLYTDSTCNYGFYEHQGMKRLANKIFSFNKNDKIDFFLYSYHFDQ